MVDVEILAVRSEQGIGMEHACVFDVKIVDVPESGVFNRYEGVPDKLVFFFA